jgi:hypothetical protein
MAFVASMTPHGARSWPSRTLSSTMDSVAERDRRLSSLVQQRGYFGCIASENVKFEPRNFRSKVCSSRALINPT